MDDRFRDRYHAAWKLLRQGVEPAIEEFERIRVDATGVDDETVDLCLRTAQTILWGTGSHPAEFVRVSRLIVERKRTGESLYMLGCALSEARDPKALETLQEAQALAGDDTELVRRIARRLSKFSRSP